MILPLNMPNDFPQSAPFTFAIEIYNSRYIAYFASSNAYQLACYLKHVPFFIRAGSMMI